MGPRSPAHSAGSYRCTSSGFSIRSPGFVAETVSSHGTPFAVLAGLCERGHPSYSPGGTWPRRAGLRAAGRAEGQLQVPRASGWEQSSLQGMSLAWPVPRSHRTVFLLCHLRGLVCPFLLPATSDPASSSAVHRARPLLHRWEAHGHQHVKCGLAATTPGTQSLCPLPRPAPPPAPLPPCPLPSSFLLCSCFLLRTLLSSLLPPGWTRRGVSSAPQAGAKSRDPHMQTWGSCHSS